MKKMIAIAALVLFAASLHAGMVAEKRAPIAVDNEKCPKSLLEADHVPFGQSRVTPDSLYYCAFAPAWGYEPCTGCRVATHYSAPAPFDMYAYGFFIYNGSGAADSVITTVVGCNPDGSPDETTVLGGPYVVQIDAGVNWDLEVTMSETLSFVAGSEFCMTHADQQGWFQNLFVFDDGGTGRTYVDFADGIWVQEPGGDFLEWVGGEVGDYVDIEDICVDIQNQDGVYDFFYPYCDTLWFSSHFHNRGNIPGVVTSVDFSVYAQNLDTATSQYYDSLLVYSENVAYGSALAPCETVIVWTATGVHLDPGIYRIEEIVNCPDDVILDNNVSMEEARIYDATMSYWMYFTDLSAEAAFGWGDGTGNAWAFYYHPKVFPINLDTIGYFLGQSGDYGIADVGVYEFDPVTGLPGTEIVRWVFDSIDGGFFYNFYAQDTLGNPVPIATIDSVGFVLAYYYNSGTSPGYVDTLRLYADQDAPRSGANHCVEVISFVWYNDDMAWYEDTGGDWFMWASISPGIMPYMCGDTNDDGTLTTGDGFNLLNYFGSTGSITDNRKADINGDCSLTTGDGFQLLNYFGSSGKLCCDLCWPGCTNCDPTCP